MQTCSMPETCQIGNFLSGIVWHFVQGLSKELWAWLACRWLSSVAATLTKMAPLAAWMSSMLSPCRGEDSVISCEMTRLGASAVWSTTSHLCPCGETPQSSPQAKGQTPRVGAAAPPQQALQAWCCWDKLGQSWREWCPLRCFGVYGLLTFMVLSPSYVTSFWKYEMRICIGTQSQQHNHSWEFAR